MRSVQTPGLCQVTHDLCGCALNNTMKKTCALLPFLLLSGCATPDTADIAWLRTQSNLREEHRLPMTFAQIQQGLFRHERLCGKAPTFAMHPRNTNEAFITHILGDPPTINRSILVDLQWVYGLDGQRIAAVVYANPQVSRAEIAQLFQAITQPEVCPEH